MFEFEYEEEPGSENSPVFLSSLLVNEFVRFLAHIFICVFRNTL